MKLLFTITTMLGIYLTMSPAEHRIIPCDNGDGESGAQCTIIDGE